MNRAHKYLLRPTKEQAALLSQYAGATRWLWNYMLDLNIKEYQANKKFVFNYSMNALLPELKKQHEWLKLPPSQSLQQKCADLDTALHSVWNSGFGFPKFKSKHRSQDSFRVPQQIANSKDPQIKISEKAITIPKIGAVEWVMHRALPVDSKVKSITVSKDLDRWYVSVLLEVPDVPLIPEIDKDRTIGIDLGISNFATYSDGTKIQSPNFLKKQLKKLKYQQRFLKNKVKGSNNSKKQYYRIAKIHQKIRLQRSDFLHKLSNQVTNEYDVICVESLKIKELLMKKQLSRSIADQGWGIFINQLQYKAEQKGKHLTKIGTYQPSTKTCSCCGSIRQMKLSDRVYVCQNEKCDDYLKTKDRDVNAARNIHFWGLMATPELKFVSNTPGTGGIQACGDATSDCYDVSDQVSVKQETDQPLVAL
jgi:putative transposase